MDKYYNTEDFISTLHEGAILEPATNKHRGTIRCFVRDSELIEEINGRTYRKGSIETTAKRMISKYGHRWSIHIETSEEETKKAQKIHLTLTAVELFTELASGGVYIPASIPEYHYFFKNDKLYEFNKNETSINSRPRGIKVVRDLLAARGERWILETTLTVADIVDLFPDKKWDDESGYFNLAYNKPKPDMISKLIKRNLVNGKDLRLYIGGVLRTITDVEISQTFKDNQETFTLKGTYETNSRAKRGNIIEHIELDLNYVTQVHSFNTAIDADDDDFEEDD